MADAGRPVLRGQQICNGASERASGEIFGVGNLHRATRFADLIRVVVGKDRFARWALCGLLAARAFRLL